MGKKTGRHTDRQAGKQTSRTVKKDEINTKLIQKPVNCDAVWKRLVDRIPWR